MHQRHQIAAAPQQGLDPGFELGQIERFGQIVVGPEIETAYPIFGGPPGSQHQHRDFCTGSPPPHAPQDFQTIQPGQRQIKNHQVVGLGQQRVIGVIAAVQYIDHMTGIDEGSSNPFGQFGMIFNEQKAHGFESILKARKAIILTKIAELAKRLNKYRGGDKMKGLKREILRWLAGTLGGIVVASCPAQTIEDAEPAPVHEGRVVIYAATDERVARPMIRDFEARNPGLRVEYHDMNSGQLYERFLAEEKTGGRADVLWSSAMDLQIKLVNDGHARPLHSAETATLPNWAIWLNEAFGTTCEPIVIAYNKQQLTGSSIPRTHAALARLLNEHPEGFRQRLITYDPNRSGLGFMLHTQDQQANPVVFWSVADAMGRIGVKQSPSTGDMLERISRGEALLGYNILGSYALTRATNDRNLGIILPADYTLVMSRVAFIARNAPHPRAAELWMNYLLSVRGQSILAREAGLFSVRDDVPPDISVSTLRKQLGNAFRPIALGTGLLTYLDRFKRQDFLGKWSAATGGR